MNQSNSLLITGAQVFDPDGVRSAYRADILVQDGAIAEVRPPGAVAAQGLPIPVLDASGQLVLPGLVNAHYHSHDTLSKGRFETAPLESWMLRCLPLRFGPRPLEELYVRTLLGAQECLRSGITCVQDMISFGRATPETVETVLRAYRDSGIRVVLAPQFADRAVIDSVPFWRDCVPLALQPYLAAPTTATPPEAAMDLPSYVGEQARGADPADPITWGLAASGPERCSTELLERLAGTARDVGIPFFTHAAISRAEYVFAAQRLGGSAIRTLADAGALGSHCTIAHCVWVSDSDIELLAATGTNVVTNPVSNLKVKNGIAPLLQMHRAGIPLALGCDNTSCGDQQNMFGVMRAYALLAGTQTTVEPTPTARDALRAATRGGAAAVGLAGRAGTLGRGAHADLVLLDLDDLAYLPLNDPPRQIVFSESGRGVRTVVVGGRILVRDRTPTTISDDHLRDLVAEVMPGFTECAARVDTEAAQLQRYVDQAEQRCWAEDGS